MCEIQFIKNLKENLTEKDIMEFFDLMKLGSINNSCAFGLFNEHFHYKKEGMFNLDNFDNLKAITRSNFIVGHNRFSTTGDKKKNRNNHPFILDNFKMVHNGIITNNKELRAEFKLKSKIKTDSFIILFMINNFFLKSKGTREKRIIKAIKKTAKKLEGSFSVFLFDNLENNLFYFKNDKTRFTFCLLDDKILVGTTNENNLEYIYTNKRFIFDKSKYKEKLIKNIEDNHIYLINDKIIIKSVGIFEDIDESFYESWSNTPYIMNDEGNEIDEVLQNTLGYIPDYDFNEIEGVVYFDYEKDLAADLILAFNEVKSCKENKLKIPIENFYF